MSTVCHAKIGHSLLSVCVHVHLSMDAWTYLTYVHTCMQLCVCECSYVYFSLHKYFRQKTLLQWTLWAIQEMYPMYKQTYIHLYICVSVCKFIVSCLLGFLWTKSTTKHVPTCTYVMIYVCIYILTYVYACLLGNCNNFPLDGKNKKERTKKQEWLRKCACALTTEVSASARMGKRRKVGKFACNEHNKTTKTSRIESNRTKPTQTEQNRTIITAKNNGRNETRAQNCYFSKATTDDSDERPRSQWQSVERASEQTTHYTTPVAGTAP